MPRGNAGVHVKRADIVMVGAGPAGMAAAVRASESGRSVTILDDNPAEGGQIWRGAKRSPPNGQAAKWFRKFQGCRAERIAGANIVAGDAGSRTLLVEGSGDSFEIQFESLILATGARELFLPFPGWTLPNVTGVGGLQALVKSGLPVEGKRVVVAGSGPLLLAVAAYLRQHGALVEAIAEQADWNRLLRFGVRLLGYPSKLWQAAALAPSAYLAGAWVTAAEGKTKLERIQLRHGSKERTIDCDYLAVAYGFWPNVELPSYLGCQLREKAVKVDELQRTTVPHIYCAGEVAGLGGVDRALVEGQIAGYAAAGQDNQAKALFVAREKTHAFAHAMQETFTLRPEVQALAEPHTIVCRCEDVTFERLRSADSWRAGKLHTRCGMGPCQGRICGPAAQHLFGWRVESIRLPVFPARIGSLISKTTSSEKGVLL